VNRFNIRLRTRVCAVAVGLTVIGLAGALSGCSSGQIAQTTAIEPAVNGAKLNFNNVALRDVRIRAAQNSDFLQPGQTVDLVLVAINQSPDTADRLVSISSDIGAVTLTGDTRLPASGKLFIGTAAGQNVRALSAVEPADAAKATVVLAKPITNGLTYNFTFDFEKAGRASLMVPISAPAAAPQEQTPAPAKHP
jgi:copper(I)-binding protein